MPYGSCKALHPVVVRRFRPPDVIPLRWEWYYSLLGLEPIESGGECENADEA